MRLEKCHECGEKFPSEILSPMMVCGEYTGLICGVCALKIRNETHGLPIDTPFQGEVAQWMYEKALEIKHKRRW